MQTMLILREEIICLFILLYLFFTNFAYRGERDGRRFIWLCLFALGHVVFDIVTVCTVNHRAAVPDFVNHGSHILFYLFGALFGAEFLRYVVGIIEPSAADPKHARKTVCAYLVFSAVYIAAFSFIPIKYTEGEGTSYSDGPAAVIAFAIPAAFITMTTILIFLKRKQIDRRVMFAIIPMIALLYIGEGFEMIRTEILITGGCITLVTVGVYFSLENPFLLDALKRAKAAEKAKSAFLASMSHEIRTPLNAVIGFAEILKNGSVPEKEEKEYIDCIYSAGTSLLALINDVLDLSKLEAGRMTFIPSPCDFRELIQEVGHIFKQKFAEKDLAFVPRLQQDMPLVHVDKLRMRQILFNLISNAIKFTEKGSITIRADFMRTALKKGLLTFCVEDTGMGIPEKDQKKLFRMFVQATPVIESRTGSKGTGLGLALCRLIVEKMNGHITLDSKVGQGSRFTVSIPDIPCSDAAETVWDGLNAEQRAAADLRGLRVLLVDDVPLNLRVLRAMLEKSGVATAAADNAESAMKLLSEKHFDYVFTDLWMPGKNGAELAGEIRAAKKWPELRIVALTADMECRSSFPMDLFDFVLSKPVSMNKLLEFFELDLNASRSGAPPQGGQKG